MITESRQRHSLTDDRDHDARHSGGVRMQDRAGRIRGCRDRRCFCAYMCASDQRGGPAGTSRDQAGLTDWPGWRGWPGEACAHQSCDSLPGQATSPGRRRQLRAGSKGDIQLGRTGRPASRGRSAPLPRRWPIAAAVPAAASAAGRPPSPDSAAPLTPPHPWLRSPRPGFLGCRSAPRSDIALTVSKEFDFVRDLRITAEQARGGGDGHNEVGAGRARPCSSNGSTRRERHLTSMSFLPSLHTCAENRVRGA